MINLTCHNHEKSIKAFHSSAEKGGISSHYLKFVFMMYTQVGLNRNQLGIHEIVNILLYFALLLVNEASQSAWYSNYEP